MLCQNCGEREARINITQIVNNQKTEIHLCHQCAGQSGHGDSVFALHKMLAGMVDWNSSAPGGEACPACGLTEQGLRQSGRFGCAQCYTTWGPMVNTILGRIHGRNNHTGKIPHSAGERFKRQRQLEELKHKLQAAIQEEKFEEAAKLRDEIRNLQSQGGE